MSPRSAFFTACTLVLTAATAQAAARPVRLVTSTDGSFWQNGPAPTWHKVTTGTAPALTILPGRPAQTVDGFGGCFNEKGWEVLSRLTPPQRDEILRELFTEKDGCGFNLGRMPIGANDYSLGWYSHDETPEDYALEHFSIDRDRQFLIPYIHEAQRYNPKLRVWASPWSPPSWMKTNQHYACSPAKVNDLKPEQAGEEMRTQFRMEPKVLTAYAGYLGRFLDEYRKAGIKIYALHVQNEPNSCQGFPSCVWNPADLATFIGGTLGPRFRAEKRDTEIWLGTIERPQFERVDTILKSPAGAFIKGAGFQWAGKDVVGEVHERYPKLPLMQTETECGKGTNDWAAAEHTFELMKHYFDRGAAAYMYWNMVLDETGNSRWGWRQNAMITVTAATLAVRYNPEFYLMKHFAHFIRPRARRLTIEGASESALAFRNPDGSIILILGNPAAEARTLQVILGGKAIDLTVPGKSFNTLVM